MNLLNGLTDKEVIEKRKKYGNNIIDVTNEDTFFRLLLESLADPIIRILLIALGIKIIFFLKDFDWYEMIGILIAIFIASFISTISEYGSNKAFHSLEKEASKINSKVLRNGKIKEIPQEEIVVDDIVILSSGDKIPADGIIIEGSLEVDESMLNGETKEVHKYPRALKQTKENFLYRGTSIYNGDAKMKVTKVGNDTYYGQMTKELTVPSSPSPLKIRLNNLANFISKLGMIGALLASISYLFSKIIINNNFNISLIISTITNYRLIFSYILQALTISVTIIVVSVPEGLPMMITLVLSSNMKRMLKNNVLVRKLVGIETSGNLNILFTDKTGTLTKGKLEVISLVTGNLKNYSSLEEIHNTKYKQDLIDNLIYNNESIYEEKNNKVIGGNITDKSILEFSKIKKRNDVKILNKVPFASINKYSLITITKDDKTKTLIKGAPEIILKNCDLYYDETGTKKIFKNKDKLINEINAVTNNGIRVIALAVKETTSVDINNMIFQGLLYIKDEVRKEAIEGIKLVTKAKIQTVMVTGDNINTAKSIAKEIGLITRPNDIVITSDELNKLTDSELMKIIPNLKVVARALPKDKSRLVKISQELNLVVGMTGDGVNDAIALKKADVGFSMGSGTSVAKEASDIVILDDNFISISKAILYGRTIFKSIRKFIIFQLTVNLCAVSISIIGPFIGVSSPVTVVQMLWINMVMDTLAGLAFSYEPPLLEYMEEEPKKKEENIINKYMLNEILVTGTYSSLLCLIFLKSDFIHSFFRTSENNIYLLTAFFGLFIFMSIFNCFNARTHRLNILANLIKNKVFLIIIIFVLIVQLILIYFGGEVFRTTGLSIKELWITMLISMTVVPFDFLRKIILKKSGYIGGV